MTHHEVSGRVERRLHLIASLTRVLNEVQIRTTDPTSERLDKHLTRAGNRLIHVIDDELVVAQNSRAHLRDR